jgi:Concanavalin A-like lectin/glucanases superfamily
MTILKHIDFQVPGWGEFTQGPTQRLGYRGEVLADSPLMYLRLGEAAGTTASDEAGQHDATQSGVLVWGAEGALAYDPDTAVDGAGTGGLVVSGTGWLPLGSSARTIEVWFKPNASTSLSRGINYGQSSNGSHVYFSYTQSEVSVDIGGCRFGVQGLTLSGQWHHAVLVYPSGSTRCDEFLVFLDGQKLSPVVISGVGSSAVNTTDSALSINQTSGGAANDCEIDEVAIYNSALTDQRILDHFLAGV